MLNISKKLYVIRVEDLKPIGRHQGAESFEPDELVYLVCADGKHVLITDVGICVPPQRDKSTYHYQSAA